MRRTAVRCRTAVSSAVAVSFVVSLMLLVKLDLTTVTLTELAAVDSAGADGRRGGAADERPGAARPVRGHGNRSDDGRHPQQQQPQSFHINGFDEMLRAVIARNTSLVESRRTLNRLRAAVRSLEERVGDANSLASPADGFDARRHVPAAAAAAAVDGHPAAANGQQQRHLAGHPVGLNGERARGVGDGGGGSKDIGSGSMLDVTVPEDVLKMLKKISELCVQRREKRPPPHIRLKPLIESAKFPWEQFYNSITQFELYRSSSSYVDELLANMAHLPIVNVEEMPDRGTQLKLILTVEDGTKMMFKPMRISKDVESNPNHFVFNEMERHHAEIAAFHLDRVFDFRRVPPVTGRYINISGEILPLASKALAKTFFVSPAGNTCFFGECKYYCDSHHAVCGTPDHVEGSCAAFLPPEDDFPRKTWQNPWAQVYSKKRNKLPRWKTQADYCDEVRSTPPFDNGRRLLDLMDVSVFDFLTGNLDRHHYYTFEDYDNFTFLILTDNGRGFGRPRKDDIELLAPIYQCCNIRASTFIKIVDFLVGSSNDDGNRTRTGTGNGKGSSPSLSAAMRASLSRDVVPGVLHEGHLRALDRRLKIVALLVHDCLNRTATGGVLRTFQNVIVDDGF